MSDEIDEIGKSNEINYYVCIHCGLSLPRVGYLGADPEHFCMRDRFATAALTGLCASPNMKHAPSAVAREAYAIAEAMLDERDK
jgi:hypothetical protein